MNKIILLGRLTKDPEVKYTPSGKCVCSFTVAVDRPFTNQDGTRDADFIPVVVWGKTAELCGNSFSKGQRILLDGRLQVRSYDAKDGTKKWISEVVADHVEFIERKTDGAPAPKTTTDKASAAKSPMDCMGKEVFDQEIPF